jgi:hypothetical protein
MDQQLSHFCAFSKNLLSFITNSSQRPLMLIWLIFDLYINYKGQFVVISVFILQYYRTKSVYYKVLFNQKGVHKIFNYHIVRLGFNEPGAQYHWIWSTDERFLIEIYFYAIFLSITFLYIAKHAVSNEIWEVHGQTRHVIIILCIYYSRQSKYLLKHAFNTNFNLEHCRF